MDSPTQSPASTPTNPYQGPSNQGAQALVVVGQQVVQAINTLAQDVVNSSATVNASLSNAFPPATTATSPVATGVNNLSTASISVLGTSTTRHGVVFHNPNLPSSSINVYVYPSAIGSPPTLAAPGGAFLILPGDRLPFPSVEFANANAAFSAFASTGSNNALTIWEFH